MDSKQFKETFLPHSRAMYWAAFRITGNAQDAEDAVQEVFVKLWTRCDELPRMDDAAAYCVRMVRNHCIDIGRRRHLQVSEIPVEDFPHHDSGDDVSEALEQKELSERALVAIGRLPNHQRSVVTMKDLDGNSTEEIAQKTGFSPSAIRMSLSRAHKTLREQLIKLTNPRQ